MTADAEQKPPAFVPPRDLVLMLERYRGSEAKQVSVSVLLKGLRALVPSIDLAQELVDKYSGWGHAWRTVWRNQVVGELTELLVNLAAEHLLVQEIEQELIRAAGA
jgi:hypothetical protein